MWFRAVPRELLVQIWEVLSIGHAGRARTILIHAQLLGNENCTCHEVPVASQLCGWCHWGIVERLCGCPGFTQWEGKM